MQQTKRVIAFGFFDGVSPRRNFLREGPFVLI